MKKSILALTLSIISILVSFAQDPKASIHESIQLNTDSIFNKLVNIRRVLHENPELAGSEIHTQKLIEQYLLDLKIEVDTNIYGHGIVGILKGGKPGKKIAWRADMDALPADYPEDVDFRSRKKGVRHGCGHDIHMTVALGIAEVLAKNRDSLRGTVYFIFQPEEETFAGAKAMIKSGLFSGIAPEEIYGLHVTALSAGQIMVRPDEMFAWQRRIRIVMKDELPAQEMKELTTKIKSSLFRVSAGSKPWELNNIVDPQIGLAKPNTIFRDYLIIDQQFAAYTKNGQQFLDANLYETNASNLKDIVPKIQSTIEHSGYKDKLLSVSFIQENPTVLNDKKLTEAAIEILGNIYGKEVAIAGYGQVPFFNDDFAYFQQQIPGVYFFLGGSNFEKGMIAMNHTPDFKVDEESIRTGVKCFSSLIWERLNKN